MAGGVGPIAMLQGKITAGGALLVSSTALAADAALSGHLDGAAAYTDAVLIPAPPPDQRVVVTSLSGSVLVAGPFNVLLKAGAERIGPVWLPYSGAAALTSGRVFSLGPLTRVLPPGTGLTVTTSAAAPQSFDADYFLIPA
jgi:hypothetical protein